MLVPQFIYQREEDILLPPFHWCGSKFWILESSGLTAATQPPEGTDEERIPQDQLSESCRPCGIPWDGAVSHREHYLFILEGKKMASICLLGSDWEEESPLLETNP